MYHIPLFSPSQGMGQSDHIAPAILNILEDMSTQVLDISSLYSSTIRSPEESLLQLFREARQTNPSVIYIPRIMSWWQVATESLRGLLLSVVNSLPPHLPILVMATSECDPSKSILNRTTFTSHLGQLPDSLLQLFPTCTQSCYVVSPPTLKERKWFLHDIILASPNKCPPRKPVHSTGICIL